MMTLRELLYGLTAEPIAEIPITGVACHSKQVRSGDLFVAIDGETIDGHGFIPEAIRRGAAAIVAQRFPWSMGDARQSVRVGRACPCVVVRDTKAALPVMAARFYGHPARRLRLVGVTGTNGKTTTTYLLKNILESAGLPTGLLGTIAYQIGERVVPSTNTTPGPLELQRYFAEMVTQGLPWGVMEVSSHALAQGRIAGLEFDGAVFLNVGSDHLDYHKTREAYAASKRRVFDYLKPNGVAVINVDDDYGRMMVETIPRRRVMTYGVERHAVVCVKAIECSWRGTSFVLTTPWGEVSITTPLIGRHNISNITAAAAVLLVHGIPATAIREGVALVPAVPGRLERVGNEAGLNVVIDYAHTAEALRLVLLALRELTSGRLIVVFGCGGDRDHTKRPTMGRMASLLADHVILTSDNPRGEDPLKIIEQIHAGFSPGFSAFHTVPDRAEAITVALASSRPGDTVLIAGKGHETYQIFDHLTIPFSDRDVVEQWCAGKLPATLACSVTVGSHVDG